MSVEPMYKTIIAYWICIGQAPTQCCSTVACLQSCRSLLYRPLVALGSRTSERPSYTKQASGGHDSDRQVGIIDCFSLLGVLASGRPRPAEVHEGGWDDDGGGGTTRCLANPQAYV